MDEPDPIMEARRAYEDTDEPAVAIATRLGITSHTLRRRAKKLGWRLRSPLTPEQHLANLARARIARHRTDRDPAAEPADRVGLVQKLRTAIEREIAGVEKRLKSGTGDAGIERAAKTLASLVRTLRELRALETEAAAPDEHEDVPRDADELRRALAERLDRLRRERDG